MKNPFTKKGLKKTDIKKIEEVKKITRSVIISRCGECKNFRFFTAQSVSVCQCAATMWTSFQVATPDFIETLFKDCTVWPID